MIQKIGEYIQTVRFTYTWAMGVRRKRKGEWTCRCRAYKFPHRFSGGKCTGKWVVVKHWREFYGHCADCEVCNLYSDHTCQVVEGQESHQECPVFQEFVRFNEIRCTPRKG